MTGAGDVGLAFVPPQLATSFVAGTPYRKYHGGESIMSLRMQCQYALLSATRSWILAGHSLQGVAASMTFRVLTLNTYLVQFASSLSTPHPRLTPRPLPQGARLQASFPPPLSASFFAGTPCWKYLGGESIMSLRMQCQYALLSATKSWILRNCHSL